MEWKIEPLKGKYYGTFVSNEKQRIELWNGFQNNDRASDREIEQGWQPDFGYDHVESQSDYELALTICDALNARK